MSTSLEVARNLSIPDLLYVLGGKLDRECTRLRETRLPPVISAASMESGVSISQSAHLNGRGGRVLE